jgi:hypothetical protein
MKIFIRKKFYDIKNIKDLETLVKNKEKWNKFKKLIEKLNWEAIESFF